MAGLQLRRAGFGAISCAVIASSAHAGGSVDPNGMPPLPTPTQQYQKIIDQTTQLIDQSFKNIIPNPTTVGLPAIAQEVTDLEDLNRNAIQYEEQYGQVPGSIYASIDLAAWAEEQILTNTVFRGKIGGIVAASIVAGQKNLIYIAIAAARALYVASH